MFALQAEALLKLHRHQEADTTLSGAPAFDADASTKFFGAARHAYQLLIRAQVDVAAGRLILVKFYVTSALLYILLKTN